ncbi:MAG: tyrosine-protein phosphatase [Gammaproteobacteria bacterium]
MNRILNLPGAVNLRDFGGYETADGRRIRAGRLLRSGTLANLTESARKALLDHGVAVICDLRRDNEIEQEPTPFPGDHPRRVRVPIEPGNSRAHAEEDGRIPSDPAQVAAFMVALNRELARDCVHQYRRVIGALIGAGESTFLLHCSAGKDRTGFGAAVILRLLGVPRETAVEDFLLSNDAVDFEAWAWPQLTRILPGVDKEVGRSLSSVRREYLEAAFDEIDAHWGGFERYVREGLQIDPSDVDHLRGRLLIE